MREILERMVSGQQQYHLFVLFAINPSFADSPIGSCEDDNRVIPIVGIDGLVVRLLDGRKITHND